MNSNRRVEDELKENLLNQESNRVISDDHEDDYGLEIDSVSEKEIDLNDPKNIKEFNKNIV